MIGIMLRTTEHDGGRQMPEEMVWVPIEDGGMELLPESDLYVQWYKHISGQTPSVALSKSPRVVNYPGVSEAQLELGRAAKANQAKVERQADQASILAEVQQESLRRFANQKTPLNSDIFSSPSDEQHDLAVLEVIRYAMKWAAYDERFSLDQQLIEARQSVTDLREGGRQIGNELARSINHVNELEMADPVYSQSLILRDAERYLWGRSGVTQFRKDGWSSWMIGDWDWDAASYIYEAFKLIGIISGTDFAKAGKRPFSPIGGEFWFSLGIEHHKTKDFDEKGRRVKPLPPSYGGIWRKRGLRIGLVIYPVHAPGSL